MTYENLLQEAADENVYVIEDAPFQSLADGLIRNDVIGINRTVRQSTKRACVLAEELGHYHTTVGDIIDQSSDANRKAGAPGASLELQQTDRTTRHHLLP